VAVSLLGCLRNKPAGNHFYRGRLGVEMWVLCRAEVALKKVNGWKALLAGESRNGRKTSSCCRYAEEVGARYDISMLRKAFSNR
jgi:hypothetical protein